MGTRNSSEATRRGLRGRRKRTKTHLPAQTSLESVHSSHPRNSIRTRNQRSSPSPRSPVRRGFSKVAAMPVEIENAIEDQRRELITIITVLHSLHSVLRRETYDAGELESDAVEGAAGWVELTDLTSMLLERVHYVHLALDSVSLQRAPQASKT
jgi:hypothetical protein